MSGLYIVALPDWADGAGEIVEGWRAEHDPDMATRIAAHVTLVFAQPPTLRKIWEERLETVCAAHAPFEMTCRRVVPGTDHFGPEGYGFLVPDAGNAALYGLRDALHAGALQTSRRPEIPFTPHVTVARSATPQAALPICDDVNARPFVLRARIARLELLHMGDSRSISAVARGVLRGPQAP